MAGKASSMMPPVSPLITSIQDAKLGLRLEGDIGGQSHADVGQHDGPRTREGYPATTQTLALARLTRYLATSTRRARVASMALTSGWQLNTVIHELLHMVTNRTEPCDAA